MERENIIMVVHEMINPIPDIILTRYLYSKNEVIASLCISLIDKKRDESLFWGYELYYSGFKEETFGILSKMYRSLYKEINPKLSAYFSKIMILWDENNSLDYILGLVIVNMVFRQTSLISVFVKRETEVYNVPYDFDNEDTPLECVMKNATIIPIEKNIYILFTDSDLDMYMTVEAEPGNSYMVLRNECRYFPERDVVDIINYILNMTNDSYNEISIEIVNCHDPCILDNWLYFASFSPIWKTRIDEFEGVVYGETARVEFPNDDLFEEFNKIYGYEPDEQPTTVLEKITNRNGIISQMSWLDFCDKYDNHDNIVFSIHKH